ncbi:hypothetical protein ABTN40_20590, partial [Acinetobacter baumannii]
SSLVAPPYPVALESKHFHLMAKAAATLPDLFGDDPALAPAPAPPALAKAEPRATIASSSGYSAKDIEVLEGLEPVRR